MPKATDVLIVSLGSTNGLRVIDNALLQLLRNSGVSAELAAAKPPRQVRTMMATDLLWALAARKAATQAIAEFKPRSIIYSSFGAALLWPRPGAIYFDAPMSDNRPGHNGLWQRPRQRQLLRSASLLMPFSAASLALVRGSEAQDFQLPTAVTVPPVIANTSVAWELNVRDPNLAVCYAGDPQKKNLNLVVDSWLKTWKPSRRLAVCGAPSGTVSSAISAATAGYSDQAAQSIDDLGSLAHKDFLQLLSKARLFLSAAQREDYGVVQLEALAAGALLVTTRSFGAYYAADVAETVMPQLVAPAGAFDSTQFVQLIEQGFALDQYQAADASKRARQEIESRFSAEAVQLIVSEQLIPQLIPLLHFV